MPKREEIFGKANSFMVEIPKKDYMCDRYIDDGIIFRVNNDEA